MEPQKKSWRKIVNFSQLFPFYWFSFGRQCKCRREIWNEGELNMNLSYNFYCFCFPDYLNDFYSCLWPNPSTQQRSLHWRRGLIIHGNHPDKCVHPKVLIALQLLQLLLQLVRQPLGKTENESILIQQNQVSRTFYIIDRIILVSVHDTVSSRVKTKYCFVDLQQSKVAETEKHPIF